MTTYAYEPDLGLPFLAYQLVDVAFPGHDVDVRVPHTFALDDPNRVGYFVLAQSGDGVLYDSRTLPGGTPWTRAHIVLRMSRGPATATLLLVLLKPETAS